MKLFNSSQFKLTFNTIKNSKFRNFWTMLGVILGVTSVILVVGVGEGVRNQLITQNKKLGNDIIAVKPSSIHVDGSSFDSFALFSGLSVTGSLNNNDVIAVDSSSHVSSSAPLSAMTAKVAGAQKTYNQGLVIGTNQNLVSILNQNMHYGNFLDPGDGADQGVVLGFLAARELFSDDVPLGRTVYINNQQFFVRGILDQVTSTPLGSGGEFNKAVFISYSNALNLTNGTISTYEILAKPDKPSNLILATNSINKSLLNIHGGQQNFEVINSTSPTNNTYTLDILTSMIMVLAVISLVVGGVGIMNVMLVAISERMHEIGIRKAVGATNKQIVIQFLNESIILSTLGGIIGIALAFLIDLLMRMFTNLRPMISWQIVVISLFISVSIGVIFGTIPAFKAASKQPIDALRID